MKPNDLNTALYEKMAAEQDKFRDWLKSQSPAEVLNHAYEYTVRCGYALNSHPAVLNGFIDLVREEHLRRQPLTTEDI